MHKSNLGVHVDRNAFVDEGEGVLRFPGGQTITNDQPQRNGTRYDIETMEVNEWNRTITADHEHSLMAVVGKALGFAKRGTEVVLDGIQFAIKTAAGRLAYDLMREGYVKDLSIETYGPWPDEEGIYYKSKLVGLSVVVIGNNKSATINEFALNSLAQAKKDGLNTEELEKLFQAEQKPEVAANTAPKTEEAEPIKPPAEVKPQEATNDKQVTNKMSKEEKKPEAKVESKAPEAPVKNDAPVAAAAVDMNALAEMFDKKLDEKLKPIEDKVDEVEKNAFDRAAKEPGFKPAEGAAKNTGAVTQLEQMPWRERTAIQIQSLYASLKGDRTASDKVFEINSMHLEQLKKADLAPNALTLTDVGNFVIPPEMVTEIKGLTSNYSPILDLFKFQETMSLITSWIERTGEVQMSDVEMEEDGVDGDLKPISEPTYETHTATLKEFAAVTPVDASAIRFSAADIVQDISQMYRRAYDRALAQSVIGRLEKAVEGNGNSVAYDFTTANGGNVGALVALIRAWGEVAEHTPTGVYIMTMNSYLHLFEMSLRAGINSPLANIFTQGPDGIPRFLGLPYVVAPSDLMPNLNTAGTKSWTFEGTSVTVNHGVLFADPSNFTGRVSGGLNFQVSTEAAYEQNGSVKSAFQRDKVVFRGYGYRKSAITLASQVSGILSPGIS